MTGVVIGNGGVLYGATNQGGSGACGMNGCGTVFSLTPPPSAGGAWTEAVLYNFRGYPIDALGPSAGLVIGSGGVLYGTTSGGGPSGDGTVFSVTPPAFAGGTWTEAVLHNFSGGIDGISPYAGLVIGDGGVLYGTTEYGGFGMACSGCGTVFALTPPTSPGGAWTETVLYRFAGFASDGAYPQSSVAIAGGVLYGTTYSGGPADYVTVFSLTPPPTPHGAWTETVLHAFAGNPSNGLAPEASLAIGRDGALYGTTLDGGTAHAGMVFRLQR